MGDEVADVMGDEAGDMPADRPGAVPWWRVKAALNVVNGSTLLGVAVAAAGRARLAQGPRGLLLATGFAYGFPPASAFTVGNVVLTRHDPAWWEGRERVLVHEERHSWQYAAVLGLPMLPLYVVAAGWSWLRGGDWSTYNVFERRAGLADGGYPLVSRRQRRRRPRTA
jgi:hypothetical protein